MQQFQRPVEKYLFQLNAEIVYKIQGEQRSMSEINLRPIYTVEDKNTFVSEMQEAFQFLQAIITITAIIHRTPSAIRYGAHICRTPITSSH